MIKSVFIENYKGFLESQPIHFALPLNKEGSGITIICGLNNSGKSTVFDALALLKRDSQVFVTDRIDNKQVKIVIEDDQGNKKILTNINNGALLDIQGENNFSYQDITFIPASRQWRDVVGSLNADEESYKKIEDVTRNNFVSVQFANLLAGISKDADKKEKLNSLIKEVFPEFNDWTVDADQNGSFIKYTTRSGLEHRSGMLGMGIVSLMRVLTSLIIGGKIIFIDEPELSLHPQAQRRLSSIFSKYAQEKQIILITHSPYFINWSDIANRAKINKTSKPEDKSCLVSTLSNNDEDFVGTIHSIYKNKQFTLDTTGKEMFFTDKKVVFCEGQEDVAVFKNFVKENYDEVNFEFFGFGCGSANNIPKFVKMAKSLGISPVALFDNPENVEKSKFDTNVRKAIKECEGECEVKIHPKNNVTLITRNGIEIDEKYKKEIKDIFDSIN